MVIYFLVITSTVPRSLISSISPRIYKKHGGTIQIIDFYNSNAILICDFHVNFYDIMKMITVFLITITLILTTIPLVNIDTTNPSNIALDENVVLNSNENPLDKQTLENASNSILDSINYHPATSSDIQLMKQQLFDGKNDSIFQSKENPDTMYATGLLVPDAEYLESLVGKFLIYDPITAATASTPSAFDLSTEPYFPQIRSQGQEGACAGFAVIYYNYGYLEALDNGWTDASTGNDAHLMSPSWAYNKVVSVDGSGSYMEDNALIAKEIGISTWEEMPFINGDHINWGDEGAWRNAPLHRINNYVNFPYAESTMVQTVKDMLVSKHPISISFDSSFINGYPGSAFADGNFILSSQEYNSDTLTHAVTIVGYDDTITDDGDIGAFKIVNSWGDDWGDNGYFWMTYQAFKEVGNCLNAIGLFDEEDYQPSMISTWEFDTSPSRKSAVEVGSYSLFSGMINTRELFWTSDTDYALPTFMCLDISELDPDFQSGIRHFALSIGGGTSGNVVEFRIELYETEYTQDVPSDISAPLRSPVEVPGIVISNWRSSTQVINENFDGLLEQSWYIRDLNSDAGTDTWGLSDYRSRSGGFSAWCAQTGTNSHNGELNSANHYYDESMDADVYVVLDLNVMDYDEMSIEFAYWAVTGSLSFNDYFVLREYYSDSWHTIWTQPQMNSGGWKDVAIQLNNRSTAFEFSFHSDNTVGLGPYEGVYIDDVSLWATEYRCPISQLTAPVMTNASTFDVQVVASDIGSGIAGVYVFYAPDGSTDYVPYQDATHPDGIFEPGTIQLATSILGGDGTYGLKSCAVDQAGNFELYKENDDAVVIVDTIAPSSNVLLTGSMGDDGWYVSPVTVDLSGEDLGSGVQEIRYRLNSGQWAIGTSPTTLTLDQDGVNYLEFYSVDNTNNQGQTENVTVNIDGTMPITLAVFGNSFNGSGWNKEPVTTSLSAVDTVSGISALWYRIGPGDFTECAGVIYFNDTGEYDLEYYAVDNAGNEGLHQHQIIMVDVTAPEAEVNFSDGDRIWYNDTLVVELVCSDDGAGVVYTEYRLNGGNWMSYSNPFTISEDGFYLIEFQVSDLVGNVILINASRGLDRASPTTDLEVDGLIVEDVVYANQLKLTLQAHDDNSGVDSILYSLDNDVWQNYSEDFEVVSPGSHVLRYRSMDGAGNWETVRYFNFTVITVTSPGTVSSVQAAYIDGMIVITWSPPVDDGGSVITSYDIYRSTNEGDFIKIAAVNSTAFNDLDIEIGGFYGYYIVANNCYTSGDPSGEISLNVPEVGIDLMLIAIIVIVILGIVIGLVVWRVKGKK